MDENSYSVEWDEENLTAHYVYHLKKTPTYKSNNADIVREYVLDSDEIVSGIIKAKKAPKIDIRVLLFSSWSQTSKFKYYVEAKNLSQNNWTKENGASVNATYYKKRYIETGINNFISHRYPKGCLLGYIVEGDPNSIVNDINLELSESSLQKKDEILGLKYSYLFESNHELDDNSEFDLLHVLLKL